MASVDYTYFTDADMPQKNMKDWHTCLKAKQISLFKKKKKKLLLLTHCQFCFCFAVFFLCHLVCVKDLPLFLLYECMFVFICAYTLQIYHGSASVLWLFTEKGLIVHVPTDCAAVTAAGCRQFCFSMKPLLLLHKPLLQTQSIYFSYHYQFVLFQLLIQQWSVPLPPQVSFLT